jgi:DDE superfamily endonuclease
MDECGIEEDICRESGRIQKVEVNTINEVNTNTNTKLKSQKLYDKRTAIKHNKTGIISGYAKLPNQENYQYIAPWIYKETCDTIVFNIWLREVFIPEIQELRKIYKSSLIALVLDNVPYHKSKQTQDTCNQNGIYLLFQPPYSPDLNPIEKSWNTTKNYIRSQSYSELNFQDKLFATLNERSWCC